MRMWGKIGILVSVVIATVAGGSAAMGRNPDDEDERPARQGSAANPNRSFSPPDFLNSGPVSDASPSASPNPAPEVHHVPSKQEKQDVFENIYNTPTPPPPPTSPSAKPAAPTSSDGEGLQGLKDTDTPLPDAPPAPAPTK